MIFLLPHRADGRTDPALAVLITSARSPASSIAALFTAHLPGVVLAVFCWRCWRAFAAPRSPRDLKRAPMKVVGRALLIGFRRWCCPC